MEGQALLKVIADHRRSFEALYFERPKYLLLGKSQMARLQTEIFKRMSTYSARPKTSLRSSIDGLIILVVPWMDGMLMLPDLNSALLNPYSPNASSYAPSTRRATPDQS